MKWRRLIVLPRRDARTIARDVDEELAFHLREREDELVAAGVPREVARERARQAFGDVDDARRYATALDTRTASAHRRRDRMDDLRQDVVYAFRRLRRAPGFTLAALATIALGIGATTGVFSVVHGVLLSPLPYPAPEQLVRVWSANRSAGVDRASVSAVDVDDWRAQRQQVADVGAWFYQTNGTGLDLTGDGEPERLTAVFVTPGFFPVMGVTPLLGRLPRDDELVRGGPDRVVVLSHAFWQRKYGGQPSIVNTAITLQGEPFTVIGVMPPAFNWPGPGVDLYASFSIFTDEQIPRFRGVRVLQVVARAKPGVPPEAVGTEIGTIARRLASRYPESANWDGATVAPLREAITGDVSRSLWVLLGAVAMLLLIACVNVASLQLARATAREGEVSVRAALGATRGRLVRQLLTESVVLSLLGGLLGIGVTLLTLRGVRFLAADQLPRGTEVRLDATVMLFALGLSLLAGVIFGLFPAWRTAKDLQPALRGARGSTGPMRMGLRRTLVIAEVALAMVLVIGGGLMVRSFRALNRVDPGFVAENLLLFTFTVSSERHGEQWPQVYARILERVRALPGVEAAGAAKDAPLRGPGESTSFRLPGMVVPPGQDPPTVAVLHVSDGYFKAIGTRLLGGREFLPSDRSDAPFVVVANESFARRWFPGQDAVGKRLVFGDSTQVEIVGLVNDIRQTEVASDASETLYFHVQQNGRVRMSLMVRTRTTPLAMAPAVTAAIREVDPLQTISSITTMEDVVRDSLARPRLLTTLLGAYGLTGLLLGALGLYGVLAYLVQQRRKDIGVRLALGATRGQVLGMIIGHGLRLTAIGVAVGALLALAMGRAVAGVLYGVVPSDAFTYVAVAAVLFATAWLASWLPARRAAGIDVVATLRND